MLKAVIFTFAFVWAASSPIVSQSSNALQNTDKNPTTTAKPAPDATPAMLSECAEKRIYGLSKDVHIPQELCVDLKKPIDRGEDVVVHRRLVGNTWKQEHDLPFAKLPPEVQKIVRLTTGEQFTKSIYTLYIILSDDESQPGKRSVKTYRYFSSDGEPRWDFKRQDKMLKLDSAEIKFPPAQSESSNLEKFTVICTKSRAYPLPAGAPMPNIPLELCFDDKKSVDRSEVITGKPKAMIDDVTLQEESDIVFDKLPPEVQKIIRLTSGEKYVKEKFHLSVLINSGGDPDRPTRKKTKDYLYHPGAEIKDNLSWAFKRQDNLLKLTQASLAPQK